MLQMTFGIDERDVRYVLDKHWDMVINPYKRSLNELTLAAWQSMDEEDRDGFAYAVMDAHLEMRNETDAGRNAIRNYLIEHRFLNQVARHVAANELDLLFIRSKLPERRHGASHR